jgi:hypothetical protein
MQALIGGKLYDLSGGLVATPVAHAFGLVSVPCSDGLAEACYEASTSDAPTAIIVLVHSFSGVNSEITVDPAKSAMLGLSDTALICPQLFGPAGNPNTCGSPKQLAHLNDVINWMKARYGNLPVFFSGVSGGGGLGPTFMGAYPGVVKGATFWCGYHDLAQWYNESISAGHVYNQLMDQTFGGPPTGALAETYLEQSPSGVCSGMKNCTVYINDGLLDQDILPHHRQDFRDQLLALPPSANVTCNYIAYPNMGHAIDYSTAAAQIQSMRGV